jgi:hypothetical protein
MKTAISVLVLLLCGMSAKADTYDYTLVSQNFTFTWWLTGVPIYDPAPPLGPPCDCVVPYPSETDILLSSPEILSLNASYAPSLNSAYVSMAIAGDTLNFQCDPFWLCGWDEVSQVVFTPDNGAPLEVNGVLQTGTFVQTSYSTPLGPNIYAFGYPNPMTLTVTDAPEASVAAMMLLGMIVLFFTGLLRACKVAASGGS